MERRYSCSESGRRCKLLTEHFLCFNCPVLIDKTKKGKRIDEEKKMVEGLQAKREGLQKEKAVRAGDRRRMQDMVDFLDGVGRVMDYDEGLVRKLVERVPVMEDSVEVLFKAGITVSV